MPVHQLRGLHRRGGSGGSPTPTAAAAVARRGHGIGGGGALPGAVLASGGSWMRMLPLLFLGTLLAAGCLRVESRRLSGAEPPSSGAASGAINTVQPPSVPVPSTGSAAAGPWMAAQDATAPPPPPKITILVSDGGAAPRAARSPGGVLGGSMEQSAPNPAAAPEGAADTSAINANSSTSNSASGDSTSSADLMSPLVAGNVTGLLADLPPGSAAAVSSYGLKIDDMAGMVVPKGYPLEQHVVITNDGYKLGTFRVPYGRSGPSGNVRPPVLLIHGISLASTCWVLNSPAESLAFILADQGYDVWMMNTRGNTFSRSHTFLRDTQPRFWNFAVDEMALIDFRETLKYVQDQTGVKKIGVVGHSQGATLALMALAADPWLSESVAVLVAMGPCAYVRLMKSVILGSFCRQANTTEMMNLLPPQELIYMSAEMQQTFLNGACQLPGTMLSCLTTMEGIFGASRRISAAQYRRYWQIWPSSTSLGNALQWSEIYNEPKPRFFRNNYGAEYDLSKVKAPVVMLSGTADVLAAPEDVAMQVRNLRGAIKGEHKVADYSHMDFIWDTGASKTVYPIITQSLASAFASS
ncbi:hypothetical protein HYH02_014414 [Chlamydomonas schloesseri]|uniref:AB hydrolase-1 domain-containing protein n=1 Tax=Chlamydomonas schloesseri TaxID=2026947 RepID=A0A835VT24_9CHLO|nr:hypothetical protein HYH02_014414 [Chlamydomonas schloesseri]|eukprot:KAG2428232.1 hypothetical protein HYH02_014414 [Chlamydomonas schloesseri]